MPILDEDKLRTLLSEGSITALTIDTSIFDEKRLILNSATLQALARLNGRGFHFVLANTVGEEVIGHLKTAALQAFRSARKGIGQALRVFETKEPTRDQLLEKITGGRTPEQAAKEHFDLYVVEAGCEILEDADLVNTEKLFEDYFAERAPFAPGKKKTEFPDALALNALERTAVDRKTGILVVAKDNGWKNFCRNSTQLYLVPDLERALALVANAPPVLKKSILDWLEAKAGEGAEFRSYMDNIVESMEFSANAIPSRGECELYVWAGELQSIALPREDEIDIIEFEPQEPETAFTLIVSLPLVLVTNIPVEVSFSFWDSIDKESVSMGGRTVEIVEEIDTMATITFDICGQGTEQEEMSLVDVEIDAKEYEVDLGEIDVFEPEDYYLDDEEAVSN